MQIMQRYEVDIDYCPSCKGVWLDRGEIDKIAQIESSHIGQHYNKYHYRRGGGDYDDYDDDDDDDDYYHNKKWRKGGFLGELFNF
jgi:Zn-finger nucleic acid-binding protein